jgi:hypothetical protein
MLLFIPLLHRGIDERCEQRLRRHEYQSFSPSVNAPYGFDTSTSSFPTHHPALGTGPREPPLFGNLPPIYMMVPGPTLHRMRGIPALLGQIIEDMIMQLKPFQSFEQDPEQSSVSGRDLA